MPPPSRSTRMWWLMRFDLISFLWEELGVVKPPEPPGSTLPQGYPELLPNTVEIPYRGHPLRVLKLEAIVQLKRASKREKDRLTLPTLEAALDRQRRKP